MEVGYANFAKRGIIPRKEKGWTVFLITESTTTTTEEDDDQD
jgi:hypothetical protein